MKAHLIGFCWTLGNGIDLEDFFGYLKGLHNVATRFGQYDRLLYISERDDCYLGLLLTVKDQKRVCEIQQAGEQYIVNVRSLADNSNLVDFNFFAIRKGSGKGLYQHYHHSCSLNQFGLFCKRHYEDLRDSRMEGELSQIGNAPSRADRRTIKSAYKGTLKWEVMVRQERLAELLDELSRISLFEFDLVTLTANEGQFTPLSPYLKRETHRLRFAIDAPVRSIARAIVNAVGRLQIEHGKIEGRDEDKAERVLRILDNPDSFGDYEYDYLADEAVLKLSNIGESSFFDEMLGKMEQSALFD